MHVFKLLHFAHNLVTTVNPWQSEPDKEFPGVIDHLDQDNDRAVLAALKVRIPLGTEDPETIANALSAFRIRARDRNFGTEVSMNLLGELTDIALPPLHSDHYEDAWDKAAQSISATAAALQSRARSIAMQAIPLPDSQSGVSDVR